MSSHLTNKSQTKVNRRNFFQTSAFALVSTFFLPALLRPMRAEAAACEITDHLRGFIPDGALATISSTGQFHHFHYLHIPQQILNNIPEAGWKTISSMMIPELGIDDFFFDSDQAHKQFHCHEIVLSATELLAIKNGEKTRITAYIKGSNGPSPNHTFDFNDGPTFGEKRERIIQVAKEKGLRFAGTQCDTDEHEGVSVFNGKGVRTVNDRKELDQLKGYTS